MPWTILRTSHSGPVSLPRMRDMRSDRCCGVRVSAMDKLVGSSVDDGGEVEKRYQVFVSSTYRDLEEERQEVMHALLELDCIPSGMELFPAANESQWNLIKKVIDDCDYYLLILGGRYGSIGPEGISYTEMEYRYALSINKPTIAFMHRKPGNIIADKSEHSAEGKAKLQAFRELAGQKHWKEWETAQELGSVVSRSLVQLIKSTPAIGWVRGNELPDKDATLELLRLRRQVDELQEEIARTRTSAPKGAEQLAQGEELYEISLEFRASATEYGLNASEWTWTVDCSWNDVFSRVAPLMIHEAPESAIRDALDKLVEERSIESIARDKELKGMRCFAFRITDDAFHTIKVQLRALGLIARSDKARSVKDSGTYWTLTPYGDEVMTRLLAIKRDTD